MNIALIAHDSKKELMVQFCIAYCGLLAKHNLCATATTGKMIIDATGLRIDCLLPGSTGGEQQIASRIAYDEIDVLLNFRGTNPDSIYENQGLDLINMCDRHNVPVATNIATAEVIITALERGDLDWRNFINPKSEYNQSKK